MKLWLLLTVALICGGGLAMSAPAPLMIADFEEPDVLDRMIVTKSAAVSLSDQDVVSGKHCLEVRVGPFSKHGDQWPYVFLVDKYFTTPLDLTRYSRVVASVRNVTDGLATVQFTLSSKPYNDGGRNLEGAGFVIPGGSTMECALPTSLFTRPMNDPSTVQALMFVFPPNETNAVYRIDNIRAVYDPAVGSPAEKLAAELTAGASGLEKQIAELDRRVNWAAVPAERAAALRQRIPALAAQVRDLQDRARVAAVEGWKGAYNASRDAVDALTRSLGEFVVADKAGFYLWHRSRYNYVRRDAKPTFATAAVKQLGLKMAQNEFRDVTWMVTAADRDLQLRVTVASATPGLAEAVQVRWSDFVQPPGHPEYGDLLVPLEGPLAIPQGESRELWATFDTRWHRVKPGTHKVELKITDEASGKTQTVPVSLTVWDFALPTYDELPNNAYVEYHNSEIAARVPEEGVRHMKMYGVNMVYVYPLGIPPVQVDAQGNLANFNGTPLLNHVAPILKWWGAEPGQDRLRWVFALSGAAQNLIADKSIVFPSAEWERVFGQWLERFKATVKSAGIADEDWMLVLADESSESVLANYEIPFAEMIKRLDPKLRITCNASQVINDPALAQRFFKAFDVLQPCLDSLKQSPPLRQFLGTNRRPLWTYRCQGMAGLDKNLYEYYRVYGWENVDYGIVGTGIWTYCAQGDGAYSETKRSLSYNLVFRARDRDQLLHSRRYEFYREGNDDFRYVWLLREASRARGAKAQRESEDLINRAVADITANTGDVNRAENWRLQIAARVQKLQAGR